MGDFELLREKSNIAQTPNTAAAIIDDTFSRFIVFFGLGICKGLLIWRFVLSFEIMPVIGVKCIVSLLGADGCRDSSGGGFLPKARAQSAGLDMPVQQQHVRPPVMPRADVESILMP